MFYGTLSVGNSGAFLAYGNERIQSWEGRWDLYYFSSSEAAKAYALERSGRVTETSAGSVWRVSVRSLGNGNTWERAEALYSSVA